VVRQDQVVFNFPIVELVVNLWQNLIYVFAHQILIFMLYQLIDIAADPYELEYGLSLHYPHDHNMRIVPKYIFFDALCAL